MYIGLCDLLLRNVACVIPSSNLWMLVKWFRSSPRIRISAPTIEGHLVAIGPFLFSCCCIWYYSVSVKLVIVIMCDVGSLYFCYVYFVIAYHVCISRRVVSSIKLSGVMGTMHMGLFPPPPPTCLLRAPMVFLKQRFFCSLFTRFLHFPAHVIACICIMFAFLVWRWVSYLHVCR